MSPAITADDLFISASGASLLDLSDFPVHDVDVILSGASRATVNLDSTLDATLSGASQLLYMGSFDMGDIHMSSSSTMRRK